MFRITDELHQSVHTIVSTIVVWIAETDRNLSWKFWSTGVLICSNKGVRRWFLELLGFQLRTSIFSYIEVMFWKFERLFVRQEIDSKVKRLRKDFFLSLWHWSATGRDAARICSPIRLELLRVETGREEDLREGEREGNGCGVNKVAIFERKTSFLLLKSITCFHSYSNFYCYLAPRSDPYSSNSITSTRCSPCVSKPEPQF